LEIKDKVVTLKIQCAKCQAEYLIDDDLVSSGEIRAQCPVCGDIKGISQGGQRKSKAPGPFGQPPAPSVFDSQPFGASSVAPESEKKAEYDPFGDISPVAIAQPETPSSPEIEELELDLVLDPDVSSKEIPKKKTEPSELERRTKVFQQELKTTASSPSLSKRWILPLLGVVVASAVVVFFVWPKNVVDPIDDSSVAEVFDSFRAEIPVPDGNSDVAIDRGLSLMLRDDRLAYIKADRLFKTALLLAPNNPDAIAGWVQNRALLDMDSEDVMQRKSALDLIGHALKHPDKDNLHHFLRAKGFLLYSLGQNKKAKVLAEQVCAAMGNDPYSRLLSGAVNLKSNTDLAIQQFRKALELSPHLRLAYRLLGEAEIHAGRFRQALTFFENRLEREPDHFPSLEAIARIYLSVGEYTQAKATYEKILGIDPGKLGSALALARILYQKLDEPKRALELVNGILASAGNEADKEQLAGLLTEKSVLLRLKGDMEKATVAANLAKTYDPLLKQAKYAHAWISMVRDDVKAVMVQWHNLRVVLPNSARVLAMLAETEFKVSHYERSIKLLLQAIRMAPEDLDLYLILATVYLELDNPNQAYSWLRKASELDPFYDRDHRSLNGYYDGPAILRFAVDRAKSGADKYGEDPLAQALAGMLYYRAGMDLQARGRLLKATNQDNECFTANLYLGVIMLGKGKYKQALRYLTKAHNSDELHSVSAILLARALQKTGKSKSALKLIRQVLSARPGDLPARLCLAEIQLASRMRKAGLDNLKRVYQGDNGNIRAKKLLFRMSR
jgi:tetratricopeptide (TPR) repeat protein/ribosomal protein S27E